MNRNLRLKVAKEYLSLLEKTGEPKKAFLAISSKWGASRASVYEYVRGLRNEKSNLCSSSGGMRNAED